MPDQEFVKPIFDSLLAEQGAIGLLIVLLLTIIYTGWKYIERRDKKLEELTEKGYQTIDNNTKALTELTVIIRSKY